MFTLGEGIFSGFFEDEPVKKPVVAPVVPAVVAEAPVAAVVPVAPAKAPETPVKVPEEVLTNEIIPVVVVTEAAAAAAPIVATDEKVAEPVEVVAMPANIETVAQAVAANEVIPIVEGEILEPAASEIVVSEVPAAVTQVATILESTVAAASATAPVKATSAEEEGLIEGLVSTFIGGDEAADGKNFNKTSVIQSSTPILNFQMTTMTATSF